MTTPKNEVKLQCKHIFDPPSLTACVADIKYMLSKGEDFAINFENVEFIGSPFIGSLVMVANQAKKAGVVIQAINVSSYVYDILDKTAITKVIEVVK